MINVSLQTERTEVLWSMCHFRQKDCEVLRSMSLLGQWDTLGRRSSTLEAIRDASKHIGHFRQKRLWSYMINVSLQKKKDCEVLWSVVISDKKDCEVLWSVCHFRQKRLKFYDRYVTSDKKDCEVLWSVCHYRQKRLWSSMISVSLQTKKTEILWSVTLLGQWIALRHKPSTLEAIHDAYW